MTRHDHFRKTRTWNALSSSLSSSPAAVDTTPSTVLPGPSSQLVCLSSLAMMSAPHAVQVDHPGAGGGVVSVMGPGPGPGNSVTSESLAPTNGTPPPEYTETPYRATPWTIGSTEGSSTLLPEHRDSLIGQAGVGAFSPSRTPTPTPSPPPPLRVGGAAIGATGAATTSLQSITNAQKTYHDRIFGQASTTVEAVLGASCEAMGFDIAEMWLRTGPKTHQLINSHVRPTALEDSVRQELIEVYYGDRSSERTHRLSPALCKRAKEAMDVVWVTAHTPHGAETLKVSISDVRTAVAVPVCHEASNTNMTVIYFSIRRIMMRPIAVEFLVHMSLAAAVAAANRLAEECLMEPELPRRTPDMLGKALHHGEISRSAHVPRSHDMVPRRITNRYSVTGARLDLQWRQLTNVEYLTDGGNSWIHTGVFEGKSVVVKTLKPECQDVVMAINEIESELAVHARLNHPNIVGLIGAGTTSKGVRFVVLERLDGGTLTQMLGYDTRIRDRRRRFWKKKQLSFLDVLRCARSIADAMAYCNRDAIPGCMVLHRDLKPDNIGFTLSGVVKVMDFGLAKILENATPDTDDVYEMSGETGSLRYMSPEVADSLPYNHKADVYSFGMILWELNTCKKPFDGLSRDEFYERVVHGGERPPLNRKWPVELISLICDCWSEKVEARPTFDEVLKRIDKMLGKEKGAGSQKLKNPLERLSGMIDRHSTWF